MTNERTSTDESSRKKLKGQKIIMRLELGRIRELIKNFNNSEILEKEENERERERESRALLTCIGHNSV